MTQIFQLSRADVIKGGDIIPAYIVEDSDTRGVPASVLLDYINANAAVEDQYIQSGTGAVANTSEGKARESVSFDDYLSDAHREVAITGAASDMTASLQLALNNHKHVKALAGRTYRFSTLTMPNADSCLEIESGAILAPSSAVVKGIEVTGARCSIIGQGSINSPASWDGTNARRTFATIWVTGEGFTASGITMNNVPRSGIHFEDATGWLVMGVKINGGFPYASYTGTQTGHCGIDYNPPATAAATDYQSGRVIGCRIRQCVQGVFYGNYDSAGSTQGIVIDGNVFEDCWNHGVYTTLGEGTIINSNSFVDCQSPVDIDGTGCVVTGNSMYTTEPSTRTNSLQIIKARDAAGAVISNNSIVGVDASISIERVTGTTLKNNIVSGNRVHRTARSGISYGIRIGTNATFNTGNKITGNTITGVMGDQTGSAIELTLSGGGFRGQENIVSNNTVIMDDPCQLVYLNQQERAIVSGNVLKCAGNIASAGTVRMMLLNTSQKVDVSENMFVWTSGGVNVAAKGIAATGVLSDNRYRANAFEIESASFTSVDQMGSVGADGQTYERNVLSTLAPELNGSATIVSGTSSIGVTNGNVLGNYTRVFLQPSNATAANTPVYVLITPGAFSINTGSGGNVAANAIYHWRIE